jgi:hypothetical protein
MYVSVGLLTIGKNFFDNNIYNNWRQINCHSLIQDG